MTASELHPDTYGFIGLGLIGGSLAKALKLHHPSCRILAYDISQKSLLSALQEGVIDEALPEIGREFSACGVIFLCAPVSNNDENLLILKKYLSKDCLLTDVGSVKTDIHTQIKKLGLSRQFIGGHPMAGSERTGYCNSRAILLENAYYILTPAEEVPAEKVTAYQALVSSLGALPIVLPYRQHDFVTAAVSHLPHVAAASLVNLIQEKDSHDGIMKLIAAGGFKDITRIASSSPSMWQQICLANTENVLALLDAYIVSLQTIRRKLQDRQAEGIYDFFDRARVYRDSFMDVSSGPIKKSYSLRIEIADEPGALASIATMLALHQISIKNIGILHNREQEDGVLSIEFYAPESMEAAGKLLTAKGYLIS